MNLGDLFLGVRALVFRRRRESELQERSQGNLVEVPEYEAPD